MICLLFFYQNNLACYAQWVNQNFYVEDSMKSNKYSHLKINDTLNIFSYNINSLINVDSVILLATNTNGVLRSSDNGHSFYFANSNIQKIPPPHHNENRQWRWPDITSFAHNNNVILMSCTSGIYKSTDKGISWEIIKDFPNHLITYFIKIESLDSLEFLAHIKTNAFFEDSLKGWEDQIYISHDQGQQWQRYPTNIFANYSITDIKCFNGVIILTAYNDKGNISVYRSYNKGQSWDNFSAGLPVDGTGYIYNKIEINNDSIWITSRMYKALVRPIKELFQISD